MAGTAKKDMISMPKGAGRPSPAQLRYLKRGLDQAGGKLPLFDRDGQRINEQTIRSCMKNGWCKSWAKNPIKPDWIVCKLTAAGREAAMKEG